MTTPAYRLLGSGRRRRLGDGRVRSVGAPMPRYTDIGGSAGVGVGTGGLSTAWVPLAGKSLLTFSLTADLGSAGVIGRVTLAVAVAGQMSAAVNVVAATALGFATFGRLTTTVPMAGAIPVSVRIGGALTRAASLAGGTVADIRVQAAIKSPTNIHGVVALGFGVSGTLSIAASSRWRDLWREVYDKRQALLNAIDANNRYLAKQAGAAAQAAADAVVQTNTRVNALDGRITAEANRITNLTTRITNTEGNVAAQASTVSSLTARVTKTENDISAQSLAITSLTAAVDGKANASVVQELEASVGGGGNLLSNTIFSTDLSGWQVIWDQGRTGAALQRNLASEEWRPVGINTIGVTSPGRPPANNHCMIGSDLIPVEGGKRYGFSAYLASHRCLAGVRIEFYAENGNQVGSVQDLASNEIGGGRALSGWDRRVCYGTAPTNARWARAILVAYFTGGDYPYMWGCRPMFEQVPMTQTKPSPWSPGGGEALARATLKVSANGVISGYEIASDGKTGTFTISADVFKVVNPNGSESFLEYRDGNLVVTGLVQGSLLSASAMAMNATRIYTGGGRLAPFVIKDTACINGGLQYTNRTVTLSDFVSPNYGSSYNWKRFAQHRMDVFLSVQTSCDAHTDHLQETVILEVQYDGGAWREITQVTGAASYKATIPISVRYTTLDNWSTCAFRARTTQGRTISLVLTVEVLNFNASGNPPGSNSGLSGGTGAPPPPPPPPSGGGDGDRPEFCVDYETTVLPDGRFVRDLRVGALVECWDENGENPGVVMKPLRAMQIGYERCYQVMVGDEALIIQSESTPMVLRDGRVVRTTELIGEEVLMRDSLTWARVTDLVDVGVRKVVKPDFGDMMFFAGLNSARTIATHNITHKP